MASFLLDVETLGLEPMTDKLSCICVKNYHSKEAICFSGKDEKKILEDFWVFISKHNTPIELIGWNSNAFDIPFIIKRCVINEVPVKQFSATDLRLLVNGFFYSYEKKARGNLGDWANIMGIEKKTLLGSEMPELYTQGNFKLISEHCSEDVDITEKLMDRLIKIGLLRI
jgi:uncharacterized protein YprB with RNaseH-like and TPR domain